MASFRAFVGDCQGLVAQLVGTIEGEQVFTPMAHFRRGEHTDGIAVDPRWFDGDMLTFVRGVALPFIEVFRPESVAWTFCGRRGRLEGFFEHEVAGVVVIDRERAEAWEARLVRHDDRASLGAWRQWPVDQVTGRLITPIQEALR